MWLTKLEKMQHVSDSQQHQLLWGFFRKENAEKRHFCFRDNGDELIVLSSDKPNTDSKEIKFKAGQTLMFECRASINQRKYEGKVIKPQDFTAEHIKEWFIRKFEGVALIDYVTFKSLKPHKIVKNQSSHVMFFNQTMFFGTLSVISPEAFDELVSMGVGKGCAFGFGAMILPQVMS